MSFITALVLIGSCLIIGFLCGYLGHVIVNKQEKDPFVIQELEERLKYLLRYIDGIENELKEEISLRHHEKSTAEAEFYNTIYKVETDMRIGTVTLPEVEEFNRQGERHARNPNKTNKTKKIS